MYGIRVMAIDMAPKRTIRKQVEERAATGLCLHCERQATRLGLCNSHYHQYRMTLLRQDGADRELWKGKQIRDGKVLPSGFVRQIDVDNPFTDEE